MTVTFRGGPLDGATGNVEGKPVRLEVPSYGNGYDRRPTGWLVYVRAGAFMIARRTR